MLSSQNYIIINNGFTGFAKVSKKHSFDIKWKISLKGLKPLLNFGPQIQCKIAIEKKMRNQFI